MRTLTTRLAAAAMLACSFPLLAAELQGAPVPPPLAGVFDQLGLKDPGSIAYLDEQGKPLDEQAFLEGFKKTGFRMSKKTGPDGLLAVTLRLQTSDESQGKFKSLKEGEALPEFHLSRLDGQAVDNKSLLGHYTVVSFYFAGCGPCVHEVPLLNALASTRKDVDYLAITFDSADETRQFVKEHKLSWPIATGAKALTDKIGVRGYPTLALIGPEGKLIDVGMGERDVPTLNKWLDKFVQPKVN